MLCCLHNCLLFARNSNDLGRYLELFSRFEFEFFRRGSFFQIVLRFFVCSEFIHTQCDLTCACVVACFHTCVDVSQQMQTHWKEKGEIERETTPPLHTSRRTSQTETDKQAHHTSNSTVVVLSTIHYSLLIAFWRRVCQVSDRWWDIGLRKRRRQRERNQ